jgi:hypothetical protein
VFKYLINKERLLIRVARISQNSDSTWTVRVGRQIEHIDANGKTRGEIFDALRWALISKGVFIDEVDLLELMDRERTT